MATHEDLITHPWAKQFLLTATRLIAKKKFEYLLSGKSEDDTFSNPRQNDELTPYETEIRNELAIDLRSLNTFSGVYIPENKENDIKAGPRYWEIDIEQQYNYSSKRVDLSIRRYLYDSNNEKAYHDADRPGKIFHRCYLEFKRIESISDLSEVKDDYKKIIGDYLTTQKAINNGEKQKTDKNLPYLFFWGWVNLKEDTVSNFITELSNINEIHYIINRDKDGKKIPENNVVYNNVSATINYNIRYFPAQWDLKTYASDIIWGFIVLIEIKDAECDEVKNTKQE